LPVFFTLLALFIANIDTVLVVLRVRGRR